MNCPYHKLNFLQKYPIFNEVIWTFELPPLSQIKGSFDDVPWKFDLPLSSRSEIVANIGQVSFKFICPYYDHIAFIMRFLRKIKTLLEIHLKIWPALKSRAEIFAKISKFWWCHSKNCPYYQPQCFSFQRRIWICHIWCGARESSKWLLAVFNEVIWKLWLLLKSASRI